MRLVLFICIALLSGLLHSAVAPLELPGDAEPQMEMVSMHHVNSNCTMQDGMSSGSLCPDFETCCPVFALIPISLPVILPSGSQMIVLPAPSPPGHSPTLLFRPPKA